ncbi:hypothetical protein C8R43DRAFT_621821 [Mycena crocata]|nr:hypothetical protein C8R43DRAFT_621821 [Mycena crocata]
MTFCPTFGTLQAMVSGSKDFRRVFQSHPKSITRAVAYNIVGPALPQALRVIRYPYLKHGLRSNIVNDLSESSDDEYTSLDDEGIVSEVLDQLDPVVMATACPEDHRPTLLTTPEKKDLTSLAKLVASLEDVYSLTTKNRTSKTSVLTSDESFRFRRAMYRIMLYTRLFPLTQYHRDEIGYLYESGVEKNLSAAHGGPRRVPH